ASPARDAPRPRRARPAEPRIAESIQPTYGWVTVAAVGGWAEVWEDGRRLGETPTRVRLRAGRHVLRIRPFGRDPERRIPITITPDETTPLIIPVR
ncbi:MAG: PEGA domain-containing protein, partial [Myxococcota bacterium]|nr:PEGA domain-containing protein [Myxococcota bacterium]